MRTSELGLSPMYRILKKAGASRVSEESADEMRRVLEGVAESVARGAVEMAAHAGRRTVRAEDVRLAARSLGRS